MKNPYINLPVVITGGCGFIGSHLAEHLVALGAQVTIIDNLSTGHRENIAHLLKHIRLCKQDITDLEACKKAIEGAHIIFHLAARTSVADSLKQVQLYQDVNIKGTYTILEAARQMNVKRVVFSSSAAVYGIGSALVTENDPCNPVSVYGFSKQIGELLCQQYQELFGVQTVILRYFNAYGPRQPETGPQASVVARFTHQMKYNEPIIIYGDGLQTRDFVPVSTIVDANVRLALAPDAHGEIFNIASGYSITLLELVERLKIEYPEYNAPLIFEPARPGDIVHSSADCSKYHYFLNHEQNQIYIPMSVPLHSVETPPQL